jgi:nicotinamide-nucleotide amidase
MYTHESIKTLFDKAGITLAVAESASAGNLSALVASVVGASTFFQGGVVAYSLRQKVSVLGVDEAHAASCNCVSDRVAREMAAGVRRLFGTDVGVSVTGYAQQHHARGVDVEVPFAWVGFDVRGHVWAERVESPVAEWLDAGENRRQTQEEYAQVAGARLVDFLNHLAEGEVVSEGLRPLTDLLRRSAENA